MLTSHRDEAQGRGPIYPHTGAIPSAPYAQHNIAWEVSGDRRFLKEHGTIDDLLREVRTSDFDVVLSSEDFECSVHHHERFAGFIQRLREHFEVKLIVYFRNQIAYAESLYFTLVRLGLDATFTEYLKQIVETGAFRWREWVFAFDYEDFMKRLESIEGVEIVARSYESVRARSLIEDFRDIVGMAAEEYFKPGEFWANERCSADVAIEAFYQNRIGRRLYESEHTAIALLANSEFSRLYMSRDSRSKMIGRFERSNQGIFERLRIPPFELPKERSALQSHNDLMSLEYVFSAALHDVIAAKVNEVDNGFRIRG